MERPMLDCPRRDLVDPHMLINYLGHVLLTQLLLPLKPSVINVASSAAFACSNIDYDTLVHPREYSALGNYAQSKLAILMWTYDLILDGHNAFAYHPSVLPTQLYGHNPLGMGTIFSLLSSYTVTRKLLACVMGTVQESASWCLELLDDSASTAAWFTAYGETWKPPRAVFDARERKKLKEWTQDALKMYL